MTRRRVAVGVLVICLLADTVLVAVVDTGTVLVAVTQNWLPPVGLLEVERSKNSAP